MESVQFTLCGLQLSFATLKEILLRFYIIYIGSCSFTEFVNLRSSEGKTLELSVTIWSKSSFKCCCNVSFRLDRKFPIRSQKSLATRRLAMYYDWQPRNKYIWHTHTIKHTEGTQTSSNKKNSPTHTHTHEYAQNQQEKEFSYRR